MDASQIQDLINEIFTYLPAYNVLICRNCGYAIHFGSVDDHLSTKHVIRPEIRTEIAEYISNRYSGPIILPTGIIEKIPELPVYLGLKCQMGCSYICQPPVFGIQKHLRNTHQWINPVKRGRKNKKAAANLATAWATDVTCQRFFTQGKDNVYFEVSEPVSERTNAGTRGSEDPDSDGSGNDGNGSGNEPLTDTLALFDQKLSVNLRKYEERAAIITEPGPLDASAWLNRTGWAAHLTGFSQETAASWLDLPAKPKNPITYQEYLDFGIYEIKDRTTILFGKALRVSQHKVGFNSLSFINRKETGAEDNNKPFNGALGTAIVNDYSRFWFKILTYIWNTRDLPDKPLYTLSRKSVPLFTEIKSKAEDLGKRYLFFI